MQRRGAGYALQLSCYKYGLEKYYVFVVDELILVSIHPDAPFVTRVPYMCNEVEYLMATRREELRAERAIIARAEHDDLVCALSGTLVTQGGTDASGRLVHVKAALLADLALEPSPRTDLAMDALKAEMTTLPFAKGPAWAKIMPVEGLSPFAPPSDTLK